MLPTDAAVQRRTLEILNARPSITLVDARALFAELSDRQFRARMRSAEALARGQAQIRAFNELSVKPFNELSVKP